MKKIFASVAVVFAFLIVLSSCNINSNLTQPQLGAVLAAQISPDAPSLGVYVNNNAFDTGMVLGTYTGYATINPGTYTFSTIPSGTTTANYHTTATIEANKYYSFFLIDSFSHVQSAFVNDAFQKPSGDSSYIRFFNFALNLQQPISLINSANAAALSSSRIFNDQASNPQYVSFYEVPAGTYTLQLKTDLSDSVIASRSIPLTGGHVYTLYARGIYGSTDTTKAITIGQLENYPQ